jgi:type IX secretion system substrate protein
VNHLEKNSIFECILIKNHFNQINMKIIIITLLSLCLFLSINVLAQNIPNGDFETWVTNEHSVLVPNHWIVNDNTSDNINVFKAEPGYDSDYAAELKLVSVEGIVGGAVIRNSDIAINNRYHFLTGYYKGTPIDTDTLHIWVSMWKNDVEIGNGSVVFSEGKDSFTEFSILIQYHEEGIPDTASINIILGNALLANNHEGSTYTIDNLDFVDASDIYDQEITSFLGKAFPSPASNQIAIPFELKKSENVVLNVFDMNGHKVYTMNEKRFLQGRDEINISLDNFSSGIYHYTMILSGRNTASGTFIVK